MQKNQNEKNEYIPDRDTYIQTLDALSQLKDMTPLVIVRLGCEMGLTRLEIVNLKVDDVDVPYSRALNISVAKRVRRGAKMIDGKKVRQFKMRTRKVPINLSLYQVLKAYITDANSNIYLLHRSKGNYLKPFIPRYINYIYKYHDIKWSPHKSRHYFKSQVWSWMMQNNQPDRALLQEMMGHQKDVHDSYGAYSWDYMCSVVDKTFS